MKATTGRFSYNTHRNLRFFSLQSLAILATFFLQSWIAFSSSDVTNKLGRCCTNEIVFSFGVVVVAIDNKQPECGLRMRWEKRMVDV